MKSFLLVVALVLLSLDSSAASLLERLRASRQEPAQALPANTQVLSDIPYGADPAQRMDVYLPASRKGAPTILMVHGGGWKRGDKDSPIVLNNKLARWLPRGVIFVSVNYRMLPEADPLTQADDVARALAFAQKELEKQGADPTAFVLMGHSAGAHLVALLNSKPERTYAQGAKPWLGTVALDSAALNVPAIMQTRHLKLYDNAFGSEPAYWRSASPLHQLGNGALPLLAVCSTARPDKPCIQAHNYANSAKAQGSSASVVEQALSHKEVNNQLGVPGAYTEAVEAFLGSLSPVFSERFATNAIGKQQP